MISHLGESRRGLETVRRNFHRSIVSVLEEYKVLFQPIHLTHLAALDDDEEITLMRMHIPVILNPASVLAKDSELPPLGRFLSAGVPLALGSDWGLPDPFENMRGAGILAKLCGAEQIDPIRLVAMHTIQAARALQMHHEVGSVEGGKKADLTFLDISDIRLAIPLKRGTINTVLRRILQEASSARVSDVMINGEFFIRKGQVMTYAEEDLKREYRASVERVAQKTESAPGESTAREFPQTETPIIPLPVERPAEHLKSSNENSESFEEGFRIIGKTGSLPQRSPEPEKQREEEKNGDNELPKTVRKIFGDDDI
jgi:5-methylthioadenosine/S-adenosylhomocysteine deaminase